MSEPKIILCPFNLMKGCATGSCRIYDVVNAQCGFETMLALLAMIAERLAPAAKKKAAPKKAAKKVEPKKE